MLQLKHETRRKKNRKNGRKHVEESKEMRKYHQSKPKNKIRTKKITEIHVTFVAVL